MYLMIDNYDSFVHNLAAYFRELGHEIITVRNDCTSLEEIQAIPDLEGIIISPGPKSPLESGLSAAIVKSCAGTHPILGVCLGHQVIGHVFGASVEKSGRPMHGKVTEISNSGKRLFQGLPKNYKVTRYHSLVVNADTLPPDLIVDAVSDDGFVMAVSHERLPVYGVQFHPEACLTQHGHELLNNFIRLSRDWRARNAS